MKSPSKVFVDETVPDARTRGIAVALLVALLTFAVANVGARWLLDRRTTNRTYWLISQKWKMLDEVRAPVDWLVLGDSSGNQGVRTELLGRELGGSALNLCTVGDMLAVNDAWMLRRYVERVGAPKHVVLVHVFDMWPRALDKARARLLERTPLSDDELAAQEPPLVQSWPERRARLLSRAFPLVSENATLADWVRHPLKLAAPPFSLDSTGYMKNELTRPEVARREGRDAALAAKKGAVSLSAANARALREIARLAEEKHFDVYIANAPIVDIAGTRPEFGALLTKLQDKVSAAAGHSATIHFVLNPPATFPAGVMENADHLTHAAAETYTLRLAAELRAEQGRAASAR